MAETIRNAALSLLILLAGIEAAKANTIMTGIDVVSTSGTVTLREVNSARATLSDDQRRVVAEDLQMRIQLDNGQTAVAGAEQGMFVISGWKPSPEDAAAFQITSESVVQYADNFEQYGAPGDIMLSGRDHPATANFGNNGEVQTQRLIWSDWLAHYFLPAKFEQNAKLKDGAALKITGAAASISRDLNDWIYYGDGTNAAAIVYERPAARDEETK